MANNLQLSAAILLSGNNFHKVLQLMNAAGIAMFSEASFLRHQRKLVIPVIDEWWCWIHYVIFNGSERQSLQVCGDGQYDSPGFSAKYMCAILSKIFHQVT